MIFVKPSIDPCSPCSHQATAAAKWLCCLVAVWFYQHGWHQQRSHHRPVHQTAPWLAPQWLGEVDQVGTSLDSATQVVLGFWPTKSQQIIRKLERMTHDTPPPQGPPRFVSCRFVSRQSGTMQILRLVFHPFLWVLLKPLTESEVVPSITRNGWYVPSEGLAGGFTVLYCFWCKHQI